MSSEVHNQIMQLDKFGFAAIMSNKRLDTGTSPQENMSYDIISKQKRHRSVHSLIGI